MHFLSHVIRSLNLLTTRIVLQEKIANETIPKMAVTITGCHGSP